MKDHKEASGSDYLSPRLTLSKAALESVCYQTGDLPEAMRDDWQHMGGTVLHVDDLQGRRQRHHAAPRRYRKPGVNFFSWSIIAFNLLWSKY